MNETFSGHLWKGMVDNIHFPESSLHFLFGADGVCNSNKQLLRSAQKYGKNVKAISVTGSINSITLGLPEDLKSRVLTNDDYNDVSRPKNLGTLKVKPADPRAC